MRVDVKKFLFLGAEEDRKAFFEDAQGVGIVEFIHPKGVQTVETPHEVSQLVSANKVLRRLEPAKQEELDRLSDAYPIADRVLELDEEIERRHEEIRLLDQEIVRVHVFGDFSLDDIEYLQSHGKRVVQFWFAKVGTFHAPEAVIHVGSAFDLDYFVSLSPERQTFKGLTEMQIDRPIGVLKKRLAEAKAELARAEAELRTFAKRKGFLHMALIDALNEHNLISAEETVETVFKGNLFMVQGWVPKNRLEEVGELAARHDIAVEEIAFEDFDQVPTHLENKNYGRVGEDLVHIYDTPSVTDRDPSRWVLWFFAFFFAVIIGDAGYGLIFLATSLWLTMKLRKKEGFGKRFGRLCVILSVSCVVWGVITSSWFGINLHPDNLLRKVSVTSVLVEKKLEYVIAHPEGSLYKEWVHKYPKLEGKSTPGEWIATAIVDREGKVTYDIVEQFSNSVMLEFAIIIGILHLTLSFCRILDRNWAGLGWILFMVGGYLFFPSILKASSMMHFVFFVDPAVGAEVGLQVLCTGIGLAIVLSLIQNKLKGAAEIANVIQVFADGLSYLRLYALGLASAMMSATFNGIGEDAGLFFGIIIILLGHSVNLVLGIVAGIIHGLRLNFLEWYRHCFEGGGRLLEPLKLFSLK